RSSLGGGRLIPCARPDGMAGHGRRRHWSLRRLSADDWSSVMASEGSGQDTEGRCGMAQSSRSLLLGFAVVAFVWVAAPAWALGPAAPPIASFSAVRICTATPGHEPGASNGVPQLFASVDVLIPGGDVPRNVQSVTVLVPGEVVPRTLFKDTNDLFAETSYFLNLTQAGVASFPAG